MIYAEQNIISPFISQDDELGRWFLSKLFKGRDDYDKMNHDQVVAFLDAVLKQATRAVLLGTSKTVEEKASELIEKLHTKESWGDFKKEHYARTYFIPKLNQAIYEVNQAQRIILESKRSNKQASNDLSSAPWSYVDKSLVKSLFLQSPADASVNLQNQTHSAAMGSGIFEWAKNNPTTAIGLSVVSIAGIFYMSNKSN